MNKRMSKRMLLMVLVAMVVAIGVAFLTSAGGRTETEVEKLQVRGGSFKVELVP